MYVCELAGEDDEFAAYELERTHEATPTIHAPGLATIDTIAPERVRTLAHTHHAASVVARSAASIDEARSALGAALDTSTDAAPGGPPFAPNLEEREQGDRPGSVAVRARDVRGTAGVDTQAAERALGQVLADRGGRIDLDDPDHALRALFAGDRCVLGWHVASSVRDFAARQPTDRPFFQPGAMDPRLARWIVNVAGARPDRTLLDPLCGTGGLPIEAALVGADVLAGDVQRKMVAGTRRNLGTLVPPERIRGVARADARSVPLRDGSVDCVVFDAPYGRQSPVDGDDLVAGALAEAGRVADRAVVVADRDVSEPADNAGWRLVRRFERRVHRSLVRHIHVLEADETASTGDGHP